MNTSLEKITDVTQLVTVTLTDGDISSRVLERVKETAREGKFNGFRPGKVPLRVVEKRHGAAIRQMAIQELATNQLEDVVKERELELLSPSLMYGVEDSPGEDIDVKFQLETRQELTFGELSEARLVKPLVEISEDDIDSRILSLREQAASRTEVDGPAEDGLVAYITYSRIDDETVEPSHPGEDGEEEREGTDKPASHAHTAAFRLGQEDQSWIQKGLDDALREMQVGESKSVSIQNPDYDETDSGDDPAELTFELTLDRLERLDLPALDDDFFATHRIDGRTVEMDEFRETVRESLERDVAEWVEETMNRQSIAQLSRIAEPRPEVPPLMLSRMVSEYQRNERSIQSAGSQASGSRDEIVARFAPYAWVEILTGLVIDAIRRQFELKPDIEKISNDIQSASKSLDEAGMDSSFLWTEQYLQNASSQDVRRQVKELVLDKASIAEQSCSLNELRSGLFERGLDMSGLALPQPAVASEPVEEDADASTTQSDEPTKTE